MLYRPWDLQRTRTPSNGKHKINRRQEKDASSTKFSHLDLLIYVVDKNSFCSLVCIIQYMQMIPIKVICSANLYLAMLMVDAMLVLQGLASFPLKFEHCLLPLNTTSAFH